MPPEPIYVRESASDIVRPSGWPWPKFPMLYLANDTPEQVTVRRLDDPSLPALILEPGVLFATSWGGRFFGGPSAPEQRRKELEKGPGIMLGVFDQAGQRRGRIGLLPRYLFGGVYDYICLSNAAEPPWVVESWEVHHTHPCPKPMG